MVHALPVSLKIWSFESQLYARDKTQGNCGTRNADNHGHRLGGGSDLMEAWNIRGEERLFTFL